MISKLKTAQQKAPPKISVVLPTYNGAKYIRQSIDSCLNQTYTNIELIIVDDGSTDDTPEIVKSYTDKRIKHLRHKKNKGLPHSLNTGFAAATGDYLTWTSDDNFYDKKAIELMLDFLESKNCEFVYCDYYRFNEEKDNNKRRVQLNPPTSLKETNCVGPCFLYSNKVKVTIGKYDTDVSLAEDYDYWIRISKKFQLCHLNEPLYFYREHSKSLSSSKQVEITISGILVRIKNDVLKSDSAVDFLVTSIAKKRPGPRPLKKAFANFVFSKKIKIALDNFITERNNFEETRKTLKFLLKNILT